MMHTNSPNTIIDLTNYLYCYIPILVRGRNYKTNRDMRQYNIMDEAIK